MEEAFTFPQNATTTKLPRLTTPIYYATITQ
ncbi:hypothetical protein PRSM4_004 [Prochlorococcus phage P-RSM4]|uniref:Uncharacterized protein n=1 Tax=Prochlorococcus phage P-RSM4 TaxID=444862 RepID=E3SLP1_9CAUD|nr:hypothetical protein PRSM4_004 [Prochlorococcus phage P-RSM4]ADO98389.1 hypothetical protein PRSM4_004 [Prochlorococcus phage P-RSM4]